jgi:hypothetical protein
VVLAGLIAAADFAGEELTRTDHRRLRTIINAVNADRELVLKIPHPAAAIERLAVVAHLDR